MPLKLLSLLPLVDNEIIIPALIAATNRGRQMDGIGFVGQETIASAVAKLKEQAAGWQNLYQDFINAAPAIDDPRYPRWQQIYTAATDAKGKIQDAFDAIGNAGNWIKDTFSTSADTALMGLGLLPLVVVGAALTAIGITAYQMRAYLEESKRLNVTAQLVREGKAPASALQQASSGGIFGNIEGITKWVVLGGVAYLAWQFLSKRGAL